MKQALLIICLLTSSFTNAQTLLTGMPVPNGSVAAITRVDNTIYIGGTFTQVNGLPRNHMASFDASTGVLSSWNPDFDSGVNSITRVGSKLVVGGTFYTVNTQTRPFICMFDIATGNLESWMDTSIYSWDLGVAADGNNFYYPGLIHSSGRCRIFCVDALTGNTLPWQSDSILSGDINAMVVAGSYIYVGGWFYLYGSLNNQYNNICRFDKVTGALDTSWHPQIPASNFGITALLEHDSKVWIGGVYDSIAGVPRKGVACFNLNGTITSFNQFSSSYEVFALYAAGSNIWVGGNSYMLGGQTRYRIAEINTANAQATCWSVASVSNAWGYTGNILVSGDTVFAASDGAQRFYVFAGSPRPHPAGGTISGPVNVISSQVAAYNIPNTPGNNYYWNVIGGTGTSTTNSINVTWGAGPAGSVIVVENNPSGGSNCHSDTIILQVTITTSVGIQEPGHSSAVTVSPNPVSGIATVQTNSSANRFELYDVTGKLLFANAITARNFEMDLSRFIKGVYLLTIKMDDNRQIHTKVIRQ